MRLRLLIAAALLVTAPASFAQLPGGLKPPGGIKLPSLSDLLKGEDPLSTSYKDVRIKGWPEFDRAVIVQPRRLTNEDRNKEGVFMLKPGHYQLDFHSFCGKGYTYGPTKGLGYILADWKGSKVGLLKRVLTAYGTTPGVEQQDVQLLIWAILAKVKPQNMQGGAQRALVQLLGKDGPKLMAEGALDFVTDRAMDDLMRKAEPAMRPFLEAENKMRGLYRDANSTYDQFERLAVLPSPPDLRIEVPQERWSLHPRGYWIRFDSEGYKKVKAEIIVPNRPTVVRDDKKRVQSLTIGDYSLHITYNDGRPSVPYSGDSGLTAHPVSKVRIEVPTERGGVYEKEGDFWIFSGAPTKKRAVSQNTVLLRLISPRPFQGFGGWGERYERAQDLRDRVETYEEWYQRTQNIQQGNRPEGEIFDSGHVGDLAESLTGSTGDRVEQIAETHGRLAEWLAYATNVIGGLGNDGARVDPSDSVVMPGAGGSQRLLGSSVAW